ncbi:hypothetical protein [Gluconacetobacter tumulisoli]|uniref:Uncharacterized protein n=1 Tax=Gluconacetobacter tumulisoli TaxID=1286189 RepID=A0A7W4K7C1_9PROT|nr:hypothetical protein [Gluconacetobacter tumulisoli]MBB2201719.1 hypothetical protein [Gluconacetobacter tumulisoli]
MSTTGSISFGIALVAGRNRVPRPATGRTAFRKGFITNVTFYPRYESRTFNRFRLAETTAVNRLLLKFFYPQNSKKK